MGVSELITLRVTKQVYKTDLRGVGWAMKLVQRIWDWLFRAISFGFENKLEEPQEVDVIDDYRRRLDALRCSAQAVLADYYRSKMLLESERANLEQARRSEQESAPDAVIAHNRFVLSQDRVKLLEEQVKKAAEDATNALEQVELLSNELDVATLRMRSAQASKRAAQLRLDVENWRMENELGLNRSLEALSKLELDARQTQIEADIASQTNDQMLGTPEQRTPEE